MIKEILEEKRLVPTQEDQPRRRIAFTLEIIEKFLPPRSLDIPTAHIFGENGPP